MKYQYIGDIAKGLGISSRSLRYYEELGMISPARSNGGFREYSVSEVEKLKTIIKLKKLGLSLEEVRNLVGLKQCIGNRKSVADLLKYLHQRLHEFEEKIENYKDGIKEISRLIDVIDGCGGCKQEVEVFKCEECLKGKDKEMPDLMKTVL